MPDEAEQIIGVYRRHAQAWTAKRGTYLLEGACLDRFRSLMPANAKVLDIGCGPGVPIARYLVDRGCSITGVDSSPEMIALFQSNLRGQQSQVADMRTLSLGSVYDGILAWDSFFHLSHDHQRRMFPIFREHAAPHAALLFTSGHSHGVAMGTLEDEPLYHASLDPTEYHRLLDTNGFDVINHVVEDPDCGGHTIWLAQLR
jgi:trans-aconitate methyltransferase